MGDHLQLSGVVRGHSDWVTAVATTAESPDTFLSASRDILLSHGMPTVGRSTTGQPLNAV